MARIICDKRKCEFNHEDECTAAVLYYAQRMCMNYKPVSIKQAMQPEHRSGCTKRGGKHKADRTKPVR